MDSVDAARLLAMGNLIDSDALIACWDSKYHYLFWRPVMAIRNAEIDGNPATQADPAWTPLLTTPNHPEYPAAHTCLSGAEAYMYSFVLGTPRIDVTLHGSADGTPNNFTVTQTSRAPVISDAKLPTPACGEVFTTAIRPPQVSSSPTKSPAGHSGASSSQSAERTITGNPPRFRRDRPAPAPTHPDRVRSHRTTTAQPAQNSRLLAQVGEA